MSRTTMTTKTTRQQSEFVLGYKFVSAAPRKVGEIFDYLKT